MQGRAVAIALVALALPAAACGDSSAPDTTGSPPAASDEPVVTTSAPTTTAATTTTTVPPATSTTRVTTTTTEPAPTTTVATTTTTTQPPTTTTLPGGAPAPDCVNGWITPAPGTALRTDPLDVMRGNMGLAAGDLFVVDEMRYFVGPEDVTILAPRRDVERWYVKASLQSDPSFQARWLVRRIEIGAGASVAPYTSAGYEPGTWLGFYGGEEGDLPSSYPGVPGTWYGNPEDPFAGGACTAANGPYCECDWGVGGCDCADTGHAICSGPPPEVMGCLAGT